MFLWGVVERQESGIGNAEFATLFLLLLVEKSFRIYNMFWYLLFLLQNIKQEVSEVFFSLL